MIHILDPQTANGIAAGEVVERPVSIVKELVENSLDAGASNLYIDIQNGGIKQILLRDNGCGMSPEDLPMAFAAHATSKLNQLSDLENLCTMGFRGEALASIAAVSKVRAQSRPIGSETTHFIELEAGNIIEQGICGGPEGTEIVVRDLFYNVPARYKFLKKDSSEASAIHDYLQRLALARPDLSIRLINQGQEQLYTPGNGDLLSVFHVVWGRELAEAMRPIDHQRGAVRVRGMIANANFSRKNRQRQIIIVNGRIIQSAVLRQAIEEAAKTWFMKGQHPCLLLNIEMPPALLDVNVHPQKLEVRFWDDQEMFRAVYHAIRNALEDGEAIPPANLPTVGKTLVTSEQTTLPEQYLPLTLAHEAQRTAAGNRTERLDPLTEARFFHEQEGPIGGQEKSKLLYSPAPSDSLELADAVRVSRDLEAPAVSPVQTEPAANDLRSTVPANVADMETAVAVEPSKAGGEATDVAALAEAQSEQARIAVLAGARLIGQVFHTYLLLEKDDALYLIDQHAAHERVLYEVFSRRRQQSIQNRVPAQSLLSPFEVRLSPAEIAALERHQAEIERLGFEIETFSKQSVLVRALPSSDLAEEQAVQELVHELAAKAEMDQLERVDDLDELYHTMACKAAIKAHDKLSYDEMTSLVRQLQACHNPYHCPHGRPVVVRLTQNDLEKMFKRIV